MRSEQQVHHFHMRLNLQNAEDMQVYQALRRVDAGQAKTYVCTCILACESRKNSRPLEDQIEECRDRISVLERRLLCGTNFENTGANSQADNGSETNHKVDSSVLDFLDALGCGDF